MLKIFGAVLIMLAATLSGWLKARQFARRPNQIRRLILAIKRLETEIMYGVTPLPDALHKIGERSGEPIRSVFMMAASSMNSPGNNMTAQESLEQAARKMWKFTAMKAPEQEVIFQLSYTLGTSDRKDQLGHLAIAIRQLESEEATAREEQARYEKMCRSLGVLCGAFIVILLY